MISKQDVLKQRVEEENEQVVLRNALVDKLLQTKFQLSATGTTFTMGQESHPSYMDVIFVLNRIYALNYAEQFKLLPIGVEPALLGSALTKEVVNWLVPILCQNIDRKVLAGEIDILAPNNRSLVFLAEVLAWYWHKELHGPRPVVTSMVKTQKTSAYRVIAQNAPLVCPLCYHQFFPSKVYKTQEAKAWAFTRWMPTHLVEYHHYGVPKSVDKTCRCPRCKNLKESSK